MLRWKSNPIEELSSIGLNSNKIRKSKLFGQSTLQKMRHGQLVSWAEFDRLCGVLKKQPGDLLQYVETEAEDKGAEE